MKLTHTQIALIVLALFILLIVLGRCFNSA